MRIYTNDTQFSIYICTLLAGIGVSKYRCGRVFFFVCFFFQNLGLKELKYNINKSIISSFSFLVAKQLWLVSHL